MRKLMSTAVAALALLLALALPKANAMTLEEQQYLIDMFRYRQDTQIEVSFVGLSKDENYHPDAVGDVCLADYKVNKLLYRGSMPLHHPQPGDIITLPYQCDVNMRALTPYSPYQWAKRMSNGRILINTPWYLLDNTDQNQWVFGRGRAFAPVFPYGRSK